MTAEKKEPVKTEDVLDLPAPSAGNGNGKGQDLSSLAEPWLHERFSQLAGLVGQQSYEIEEKKRRKTELEETAASVAAEVTALAAELVRRERARDKNQVALDFVRASLAQIQGDNHGKT